MKEMSLLYEKQASIRKKIDYLVDPKQTLESIVFDSVGDSSTMDIGDFIIRKKGINKNSIEFADYLGNYRNKFFYSSHFEKNGKITIECSLELLNALQNTKLDNIKINDILFPFNSFFLKLDNVLLSGDGITLKVLGAYIVNANNKLEITVITDNIKLGFLRLQYPISMNVLINDLVNEYSNFKLYDFDEFENLNINSLDLKQMQNSNSNSIDLKNIAHLLFSSLLYLNSYWEKKDDRIITKYDYDNVLQNSNKGSNKKKLAIKLANAENIIYLKMTDAENKQTKYHQEHCKIKNLFLVRGHWRKQPVGKKEENKYKTIWIKPFWKGEGEIIGKTYKNKGN